MLILKISKIIHNILSESKYEADVALENLFHHILGDEYLDNRNEILDDVYTTLGMRTINWAFNDLVEQYPNLIDFKKEFFEAAKKEGYESFDKDDWSNS